MNHVTSCKSLELVPWSDSLQACTVCVVLCSHTAVTGRFWFCESAEDQNLMQI